MNKPPTVFEASLDSRFPVFATLVRRSHRNSSPVKWEW